MKKIDMLSLEDLEEILQQLKAINQKLELLDGKQKWLGTKEVAKHTNLSIHTIKSKVKNNDLLEGVHYHKRGGKLFFNIDEVDKWVMGMDLKNYNYLGTQLSDEQFGSEYDRYLEEVLSN